MILESVTTSAGDRRDPGTPCGCIAALTAAGQAAVVTLSEFSQQAVTEAHRLGVELIDGKALLARIELVRRSEPCPRCSTPMIIDRSSRGWWLRCPTYPRCDGKRDLGTNAGAAVDRLTS